MVVLPPQPSTGYAMGQALGGGLSGLGQGLGQGISNIINQKLQRMQMEQKQKSLQQSLAPIVGPEKASLYSALGAENPQVLGNLLKMEMEAPGQRFYENILAGTPMAPEISRTAPRVATEPTTLEATPQVDTGIDALQPLTPEAEVPKPLPIQKPLKLSDTAKKTTLTDPMAKKLSDDIERYDNALKSGRLTGKNFDKVVRAKEKAEKLYSNFIIQDKKEAMQEKKFDRQMRLKEKNYKLQKRKYISKLDTERRREHIQRQKDIDSDTKETYQQLIKEEKAAKDNDMRLDRMEELNNKGYLGSNIANSAIDMIGRGIPLLGVKLNVDFLKTADAQEFQKLSMDFLKSVKDIFGARVTQQEVQMFLKTVPTLTQSRDGRAKVIKNLRIFNKATHARFDAMNEIIKENNGERPPNFEAKLEKRASKKLKALAKQFKSQIIGATKGTAAREFIGLRTAGV